MAAAFTIAPRGPFSLARARAFIGCFRPAGQPPGDDFLLVLDGALVRLAEDGAGVRATVVAGPRSDGVEEQVTRILSLDHDAAGWVRLGERDAVIGALQREAPGLRPVLFPTPWEASVWAILTQRSQYAQALRARDALVTAAGTPIEHDGVVHRPFPGPEALLAVDELPLPAVKAGRVRGLAEAALRGELDPRSLRALDPADAFAALLQLDGVGPFSASLILIRGAGAADASVSFEPRIRALAAERYGDPALAGQQAFAAFEERWRPWRSWAGFTLRAT